MNPSNLHAAKRIGVLLLIVSLSASTLVAHPATAQVPVYRIEGNVYGPDFKPLQGAAVSVLTASGSSAGTATTDAAGKYTVTNLASGTYNVTVSHACCDKDAIPVVVSGTDPVVQQNFRLRSSDASAGGPAHSLRGVVKDEAGKPLSGVHIELWNYYEETGSGDNVYIRPPGGQKYLTATSGSDGAYSFSVRPGHANLIARKDGFQQLHANFEVRQDRILDLPMKASAEQGATVKGVVKDTSGKPIQGAWVNIQPDYRCDGDVCTASSSPAEPGRQEGDVYFYYQPTHPQYNGTTTGANGAFEMRIAPGNLVVSADAHEFVHEEARITVKSGETKTVDLVMERVPADSVRLSGVITDAKTGKPVAHAQVHVENQQWGAYNSTQTDKDGKYVVMTKPGYVLVTASAYRYYYVPCARAEASDEPASSGTAKSMPAPGCAGESGERETEYFPRVATLNESAGKSVALDFKLEPRPAPTSTFKGYVVNASSQLGVPDATISFYNEKTRDYGSAVTDQDGSYQIQVHGGYYTIRVYAQGYFDGALNAEIADGASARLDVFVTPGERRYGGGCCYYVAMDSSGSKGASGMSGPMPQAAATTAPGRADSEASESGGQQAYAGSGGGLGPYKPASADQGNAPGLAPLAVMAAAVAAAIVVGRRREA